MKITIQETKTITKNERSFVVGTFYVHNENDLYPVKAEGIFSKEYSPGDYEIDFSRSVYINKQNRLTIGQLTVLGD